MKWAHALFAGVIVFCLSALPLQAGQWCVTPDSAYGFADQLFEKQDYEAAATEFARFVHFFPDDSRAPHAAFKAGMAFFSNQQYRSAMDAFDNVIKRFSASNDALESRFMISRCYQKLNETDNALRILQQIIGETKDRQVRDRALNSTGWLLLEAGNISGARKAFGSITRENQKLHHTGLILSAIDDPGKIEYKSPLAAGMMSVVPGGGYLYTGRYRESGVAFFLTAALAAASWQCFDKDLSALGAITGLVGLGFYSGSIAGGITSAHKYNQRARQGFIQKLKADHGPEVSLHFQPKGAMLAIHCAF